MSAAKYGSVELLPLAGKNMEGRKTSLHLNGVCDGCCARLSGSVAVSNLIVSCYDAQITGASCKTG